jgi:hypothetical protein
VQYKFCSKIHDVFLKNKFYFSDTILDTESISTMPETATQTPPETCHECAETVTRIIDEGIAEQDRLTQEFIDSTHQASQFQEAAEIIEYYLSRIIAHATTVLAAIAVCDLRWPNIDKLYNYTTHQYQYNQNNEFMTDEKVAEMEGHQCFKNTHSSDSYNFWPQVHKLQLYLNLCKRKELLPARVVLQLQLGSKSDIFDCCCGRGPLYLSSTRKHYHELLNVRLAECKRMRDTLWNEDLLLPLEHPRKRRRISPQ